MAIQQAFYVYLNTQPRKPLDLNRDPDTENAKEVRREIWRTGIEEHSKGAKRILQKATKEIAQEDDMAAAQDKIPTPPRTRPELENQYQLQHMPSKRRLPLVTGRETAIPLPCPLEPKPIDRQEVFQYLLQQVKEHHGNRYREMLEWAKSRDLFTVLEENLMPQVRVVSANGLLTLEG